MSIQGHDIPFDVKLHYVFAGLIASAAVDRGLNANQALQSLFKDLSHSSSTTQPPHSSNPINVSEHGSSPKNAPSGIFSEFPLQSKHECHRADFTPHHASQPNAPLDLASGLADDEEMDEKSLHDLREALLLADVVN